MTFDSYRLADTLVTTSVLHAEPWIARLWSVVRKSNLNEDSLATPSISVLVKKVRAKEASCTCIFLFIVFIMYYKCYYMLYFYHRRFQKLLLQLNPQIAKLILF